MLLGFLSSSLHTHNLACARRLVLAFVGRCLEILIFILFISFLLSHVCLFRFFSHAFICLPMHDAIGVELLQG